MSETIIYECRRCDRRVSEPLSAYTDHPNSWVYFAVLCDTCSTIATAEMDTLIIATAEAARAGDGAPAATGARDRRGIMECPTYSAICRAVGPDQEEAAKSTLVDFGRFRIKVLTSMESVAETGGNVDDHYKLTEHDEETGEPYDVCPSCSDDWPCMYGKLEAAQQMIRHLQAILQVESDGAKAALTGEPITANPWDKDTTVRAENWHLWRQGWTRASADALFATVARYRSLLECAEHALEWIFDHCDDPKLYRCDCAEDGGYMEHDTNAFIHTDRCSAGMDDSMGALRDQIRQALGKAVIDVR